MSLKLQLRIPYDAGLEDTLDKECPGWLDYRVISKALDARKANKGKKPQYLYTLEVIKEGQKFEQYGETFPQVGPLNKKPLIIGMGPAGLFCALRLAEYGIPCILLERGVRATKRMIHIARHWRYGEFDRDNNVCFGEGGAGLFSDGKLITRVKSPHIKYVMNKFVEFGAPEETAYISNPHLGSNKIRQLITKMANQLESQGHELHFQAKVTELITEKNGAMAGKVVGVRLDDGREFRSDHVILAVGHSAHQMYRHLEELEVPMRPKDFAVGVRVEHPRRLIDHIQLGDFAEDKNLGAARYRLSYHQKQTSRGSYSFCMCPGGYVLSSGTEDDGIVVNGMSNYARNAPWSNSALVVSVKAGQDYSTQKLLGGVDFQRSIETKAYDYSKAHASGKEVPYQNLEDFIIGKVSTGILPKTSCPSGIVSAPLHEMLPSFVTDHLRQALLDFDVKMPGFVTKKANFLAPETRTSAPVTILRDKINLDSPGLSGFYPCGEGAGHAGGITSAAVDGIKVAMAILKKEKGLE